MTGYTEEINEDGSTTVKLTGQYYPCHTCKAPAANPFPDDWRVSIQRNLAGNILITPHSPDCTETFEITIDGSK